MYNRLKCNVQISQALKLWLQYYIYSVVFLMNLPKWMRPGYTKDDGLHFSDMPSAFFTVFSAV